MQLPVYFTKFGKAKLGVQRHIFIILALGELKHKDNELEASLDYINTKCNK